MRALITALSLLLTLIGCSNSTPSTRYYLLTDPFSTQPAAAGCAATVKSVTLSPYLQRNNIMLQTTANELVPAVQHRWSEPLQAGALRLLQQCLAGSDATRGVEIDVHIDHLHGSEAGNVVLQGHWQTRAGAGETRKGRFDLRGAQSAGGYDALVAAHADLLRNACLDIRAALPDCS